jgi:hypothetical protein
MPQPLLKCGPFVGLDATKDDYYLKPGDGTTASNVDVSYSEGAMTVAFGRNVFGSITLPAGYTLQSVVQFTTFPSRRIYVFSAVQSSTDQVGYQGWYDPVPQTTNQLLTALPFTQAVQFGSALWTNGGNKITFANTGSPLSNPILACDIWQIQVPSNFAYNLNGTTVTQSGNATDQQYTYAVTIRRAATWTTTTLNGKTYLLPDLDSYQESSPVFSSTVTVASGQQPALSIATAVGSLASLIIGLTIGGETFYGALYRSSTTNPTYTFVDFLANLPQGTGADGNPCFIDTAADADLASNASLTIHHDPPPILGQVYPGPPAPNTSAQSLQQQNQQVSFNYINPSFITKHMNRVWTFTLYPTQPVITPLPNAIAQLSFQPQLWCSDYGVPWSFNDDASNQQIFLVGPEDTPGNAAVPASVTTVAPWVPGQLEDTPMGLARAGSILVVFKSQTTWIVEGQTPAEFLVVPAFDIGCMASNSITEAEGGVFWLAPQGVYFFSGGSPSYISEDVRGILDTLPWAQRQAAVGAYRDRTFYLSVGNQTFAYYTPSQKWYTLPYGASLAVASPYNQNQLLFVNGNVLQSVDVNPATDLGQPITATWASGVTDSEAPGQLKQYRFMQVVALQQQGMITAKLTVDSAYATQQSFSWTWDLSLGNGAFVVSLPEYMAGYAAQLTVTATTNPNATAPLIVRAVIVTGDVKHGLKSTTEVDGSGALNGVLHG